MPLGPNATAGDWIKDFINSDNPKFAGKSKKERQKMALAAYYARSRNEEVEQIDEGNAENKAKKNAVVATKGKQIIGRHLRTFRLNDPSRANWTNDVKNPEQQLRIGRMHAFSKEETEQIDELSTKTLKSYSKKSSRDAEKHINRFVKGGNEKSITRAEKRSKGINTAQQLLARKKTHIEETEMNENELNEGMTRKHFQMVADLIKGHKDPKKRSELAHHHAAIFKADNPRFDHDRFFKAANAERHPVKEDVGHEALFAAILDGNRDEANDIFDSVLSGRVDALVADKKQELAASLFNQPEEQVEELDLLGITEEFEPLELIAEETHGHHHQVYSELTDRNKRLADAAANTYARGDITKDHKREIMRHFNLADKSLETAKNKLGSAEAADHLNVAATHITDGGLHLQNVRAHTSLGYASY